MTIDASDDAPLSRLEARALRKEARELRDAAAADRKAADEALAAVRYAQGQAEFHNREASEKIASIQKRETLLEQYGPREAALAAREKAVLERERAAAETMRSYNRDKHVAMQVLTRDLNLNRGG